MGSKHVQVRILEHNYSPQMGQSTKNLNFGWAHKISEPGSSSVRSTADKYLFVSAPGHDSNTGRVYMYNGV